jgi:transcriptional regulator with XRE-family HTH domain
MTFGQTLQKIRRAKGKTQRNVADAIGMDYGYYSRIENDRFDYKPSRETIEKIIETLECDENEKAELLAAAGRIDTEMRELAQKAVERPELRSLFRAAVEMPKDKIEKLLEIAAREEKEKTEVKKSKEEKSDDED